MTLDSVLGNSIEWVFRTWVRSFGRKVADGDLFWLEGPTGTPKRIGSDFFEVLNRDKGLETRKNEPNSGLMKEFDSLRSESFDTAEVDLRVKDFYERTVNYRLDVWSQWHWAFRPLAWVLVSFVSRRIEQLNLPVSPLDTSRGMTSDIIQLIDRKSGENVYTCWLRKVASTGDVIYAGFYSTCRPPNYPGECVKVVFPLPKGSATVVLKPIAREDGSLELSSSGSRFGDPGYYRVLQADETTRKIRYIRAMKETIHVYVDDQGALRTDHVFKFWRVNMLKLHYKIGRVDV
jgi:hypothetical protein